MKKTKFSNKCSDYIANFGGSWRFIISAAIFLAIWMIFNLKSTKPFDPPPFIGLNLILSCVAAFQAPFILMSQNRQSEKDRKRDIKDLNIDIETNIKIKEIEKKIDVILKKID
jgi:uncharacterized membrane protein